MRGYANLFLNGAVFAFTIWQGLDFAAGFALCAVGVQIHLMNREVERRWEREQLRAGLARLRDLGNPAGSPR